ncbi:ABC transporter ATP-binding protein [Streptomyces sp. 4.24]|uniref:ABC transporter ATP-binding protein n=1 Tax=Streptomyces tritrimontium TaxID=3406573 RepID=UPI003BB7B3C1
MSTGTAQAETGTAAAAGAAPDVVCAVRDLVKTYPAVRGRRGAPALPETRATDGISLDVRRGEIFGLLGPNGAGKSTLVRQLTGLMRPDSGSVSLLGHDLVRHPERAARLLSYLGQESTALDELTVSLAAETTGRLRGLGLRSARAERDAVLEELGLTEIAGRPLKKLSGGQRRLACFAAALVGERPVLVLDEPTTGMDPVARRAVWSAVDRRRAGSGATVLLVTHNVIEAETVLDRVAVIDQGRVIACDTPAGLKAEVSGEVRLELVWRTAAPLEIPEVAALAASAAASGRRWVLRLGPDEARAAVAAVTGGPAFAALDDFTLATPSLEDVYLALGGRTSKGLVKA